MINQFFILAQKEREIKLEGKNNNSGNNEERIVKMKSRDRSGNSDCSRYR